MRRKQHPSEDIKHIINNVIGKIEKDTYKKKERILDAWRKAVGENALQHSRPVNIRRNVLIVEIDSSTWFYELNFKKVDILNEINKYLGGKKIEGIRFRMG